MTRILLIPAFRHVPQGDRDHREAERNVQKEDPVPRELLDQPSSEHRADPGGDRRITGPRPDRPTAIFLRKGRADYREASRYEHRRPDALNRACRYQLPDRLRKPASQRRDREHQISETKDLPSPPSVSQRTADQDQCREHQRIRFDDPLQPAHARIKVLLKCGQRDIYDCPVDKGHARAEYRSRQHPRRRRLRTHRTPVTFCFVVFRQPLLTSLKDTTSSD